MGNYFEHRKADINNQIDDMLEVADNEGYHRGYDEAWDEARDKGFDEGFDEGIAEGKKILMKEILTNIIPEQGFFATPESQEEYEAMMNQYKDSGAMCAVMTTNWLNKVLSEMDFDE